MHQQHNAFPSILAIEAIEEVLLELQQTYPFEFDHYESGQRYWQIVAHPKLETILFKQQQEIGELGEAMTNSFGKAEYKKSVGPFLFEKFSEYFEQLRNNFFQAHPGLSAKPLADCTYPIVIDVETAMQVALILNRANWRTHGIDPFVLNASHLRQLAALHRELSDRLATIEAEIERKQPIPLP